MSVYIVGTSLVIDNCHKQHTLETSRGLHYGLIFTFYRYYQC